MGCAWFDGFGDGAWVEVPARVHDAWVEVLANGVEVVLSSGKDTPSVDACPVAEYIPPIGSPSAALDTLGCRLDSNDGITSGTFSPCPVQRRFISSTFERRGERLLNNLPNKGKTACSCSVLTGHVWTKSYVTVTSMYNVSKLRSS